MSSGGVGGTSTSGGSSGAGASSSSGTSATGGSTSSGGTGTGGSAATGGTAADGGSSTAGGAPVGGATPTGGAMSGGGSSATGGVPSTAGSNATGGTTETGGETSSGGSSGTAGASTVDQNGVPLAKPGDQKTQSREYLNLGDFRVLINKWGSDELGCNTSMRVFVNDDRTFGWSFDRGGCGGNDQKPDYPEIEFGIHPFGIGSSLETSPPFPSTTLLPLQIKDITSASILIDDLNINLQKTESWNIDFEFWLSQRNPVTDPNPGVYAEVIGFWGWEDGRWPCDKSGNVSSGGKTYRLCHQDDNWAGGRWRYFQFWVEGGPNRNFSGKVDIKPFLDWLVNNWGYSKDLWVTRLEVGSEIDDNTSGTVTLRNISFEVNGTTKTVQLGE